MFAGMTRFTDFQRSLGVAPNILTKRLAEFVEAGIFEQGAAPDGSHPEYVLTDKGLDLQPVIIALTAWGDKWAAPDGPPVAYQHRDCGGRVTLKAECGRCGKRPGARGVRAVFSRKLHPNPHKWAFRSND